jgi:transposase
MTEREVRRAAVFSRVVKGGWTLLEAAERMEVSYRQAKRQWERYRGEGGRGWCMGARGGSRTGQSPGVCGGQCGD